MSFFDSLFGNSGDANAVGNQVLQAYYNEAIKFAEFQYASYDSWITWLNDRVPDYVSFIGDLVLNNYASTTVEQAASRLMNLASQSSGTATIPQITAGAGGRGDTVNWSAGLEEIGINTAVDAANVAYDAAQSVSTGVLSSVSMLKYLPWILGAGAALYIVTFAKSSGGSIGKGIGDRLSNVRRSRTWRTKSAQLNRERIRGRK